MTQLLIKFIVGIVLIISLSVGVFAIYKRICKSPSKPSVTQIDVENLRQRLKDSIRNAENIDSIAIFKSGQELEAKNTEKYKRKAAQLGLDNESLSSSNDTLRANYERNRTLSGCDSLVIGQRKQIIGLKAEASALDSEALSYSKRLFLSEQIIITKDTIIGRRDVTIKRQDAQISQIQCSRQWAFEHKFWAWVFGYNCK
jgi:hypothetical protein